MKKTVKTALLVLSILVATACSNASETGETSYQQQPQGGGMQQQGGMQGGGMQQPQFEKISEEDFYAGLNVSAEVKSEMQVVLNEFKEEFESKMQSSGGRPPQREEMETLVQARDAKIKPLLTDAQYVTYQETVEGLFVPEGGPGQGQGPRM